MATHSLPQSLDMDPPVVVTGPSGFELSSETLGNFEEVTESVTVVCATGARHTADWTGVRVIDLVDVAGVPASTTHIVVESTDEYRVAIPVAEALDGIVAYLKDGVPIGADHDYANRFVSPATDGARDIKGVSRIEHASLGPDEDPETLENLFPEGDRFTAHRHEDDDQTQ